LIAVIKFMEIYEKKKNTDQEFRIRQPLGKKTAKHLAQLIYQ